MKKVKVRFGLLPWLSSDPSFEKGWVTECESLGFHSIYVTDHLAGGLEAWTKLSALSTFTNHLRLGTVVLNAPLRNPVLLANMAASLDVVSGGRLELGLGAGHIKGDFEACGTPFLEARARIAQLEEAIRIIKGLWTSSRLSFHGSYYRLKDALCPRTIQRPHPPLMVGGQGERLTLKVAAKHADVCNLPHTSPEETKHKLKILKEHCLRVGRDFEEIEGSWFGLALVSEGSKELEEGIESLHKLAPERYSDPETTRARAIVGTPEQCLERLSEYLEAGITYFILYFPSKGGARLFSREVIPKALNL